MFYKVFASFKSGWKNLTRSLKLTAEEKYLEQVAEFDRWKVGDKNQDACKNYNYRTWWAEYNQTKTHLIN